MPIASFAAAIRFGYALDSSRTGGFRRRSRSGFVLRGSRRTTRLTSRGLTDDRGLGEEHRRKAAETSPTWL